MAAPPRRGLLWGRPGAPPPPADRVSSCSRLHPRSSHSNPAPTSPRASAGTEKFIPSSENATAPPLPTEGTLPLAFLRQDRAPGGPQTCWEANADSFPGASRAETHGQGLFNGQGATSALAVGVSPLLAGGELGSRWPPSKACCCHRRALLPFNVCSLIPKDSVGTPGPFGWQFFLVT